MANEFILNSKDIDLLSALGIDVIKPDRKYWFLRTQAGKYYSDFTIKGYIGIEWDAVSDLDFIKRSNQDNLKKEVIAHYPKAPKQGYIAGQIKRFVAEMRKGDIVLIPSEKSSSIAIGEITSDAYINSEDELDQIINKTKDEKVLHELKKRRNVEWIDKFTRSQLDPYLHRIIYAHNTIVDVTPSCLFVDRMLSQFYVKGDQSYITFKVNKKNDIHYSDILSFLSNNSKIIDFVNKYGGDALKINIDDIIIKMNVQSKGPIQLNSTVRNIIIIGLIITFLCGAKFKTDILGLEIDTPGLPNLIKTVHELFVPNATEKDIEIERLKEALGENKKHLQLQLPENSETNPTSTGITGNE
jgi:restriction system protein